MQDRAPEPGQAHLRTTTSPAGTLQSADERSFPAFRRTAPFFSLPETMVTGFWPGIALYILAAALMEAAAPQGEPSGEHVPDSPAERARLMRDMKERILRLDKRIQRMEDQVVRPDFQWDSRWGRERSTSARVEKTGHGAAFPRAE